MHNYLLGVLLGLICGVLAVFVAGCESVNPRRP